MRFVVLVLCVLVPILGTGCQQPESETDRVPDAKLIVPGERLGTVSLGTPRAQVMQGQGTPQSSWSPPGQDSLLVDVWQLAEEQQLVVYYNDERVVQVHTTSPEFSTAEHTSIQNTFEDLRNQFGPLQPFINPYETGVTYYDATDKGIAFAISDAQSETENSLAGDALAVFVHLPGMEVLIF